MSKLDKNYVTSIAAPTLVGLIRDTGKSSYLRQKTSHGKILKEEKWQFCFAVLVNTALYVYDDETSQKTRDCVNLVGYNCIKRIQSDRCLFGFAISSTSKSKSDAVFSTFSDAERRAWMKKIKEHLCKCNNVQVSPGFLFGSTFDDESEYVSIEEPVDVCDEGGASNGVTSSLKKHRRNAITEDNYLDDNRT